MKQSNAYVLTFTVILTVLCAGLLGGTANVLKDKISSAKKLDARKGILGAVTDTEGKDINALFKSNINGYVVNSKGDIVKTIKNKKGEDIAISAEEINPRAEYKKTSLEDKLFPVFEYKKNGEIEAYVLPIYGNGLWDEIYGFIAVKSDFNTVKGIGFGHKAETPGLGARITEAEVQGRFQDRLIYDAKGMVALQFLKGEKNVIADDNKSDVDGLSGASMTTKGVNAMLSNYMGYYKAFFDKHQSAATPKEEEVKEEVVIAPAPVVVDSAIVDSANVQAVDSVNAVVVDSAKASN